MSILILQCSLSVPGCVDMRCMAKHQQVQESIRKKRLAKKRWDIQRDEESKQEYKEMRREAKKEVAKAKSKAYDELYEELDNKEGDKTLY